MTIRGAVIVMLVAVLCASPSARLAAQDPALVEALAPLLRAQDRKAFDQELFETASLHPEAVVRRSVALAIGRIGDRQGSAILLRMLDDRDSTVVIEVMFALGLLRDTTTVDPIIRRLKSTDSLSNGAVAEAATALIRLGTPTARNFVESVLKSSIELSRTRRQAFIPNAVLDAWRFGANMPADAILPFVSDTSNDLRWRALYSLGRARAPVGGKVILRAATEPQPILREAAVKALVRRMADSAALPLASVRGALLRGFDDERPGVRINALGAAASFADSSYAARTASLLGDPDQNVRVAAATALGEMKSPASAIALAAAFDKKGASWALRRASLAALARLDTAAFAPRAAGWLGSPDLRDRLSALAAWGSINSADPAVFRTALTDPDATVQSAALAAWQSAAPRGDSSVASAARARLTSTSAELRAGAAEALRATATLADLDPLLAAWRLSASEGDPNARLAVFRTLRELARRNPEVMTRLEEPTRRSFLSRPGDALVRREAELNWPAVAAQWGPASPLETGRSLEDYRGIVRTLMLAKVNPHVTIELDGYGTIDIELLAHDSPLTVANFLRLVDRHYFDGIRWHRVVPNFVVQTGDPSGTGNGGPGWVIRDEINRRRYDVPVVGMALSGPDTGGSQWFINLSAQPHLDGGYTIFGQVSGSYAPLYRIVQGDLIRTIHR